MSDEYQTRQFFEQPIKWVEISRSPNPKTYLLTGKSEQKISWFTLDKNGNVKIVIK